MWPEGIFWPPHVNMYCVNMQRVVAYCCKYMRACTHTSLILVYISFSCLPVHQINVGNGIFLCVIAYRHKSDSMWLMEGWVAGNERLKATCGECPSSNMIWGVWVFTLLFVSKSMFNKTVVIPTSKIKKNFVCLYIASSIKTYWLTCIHLSSVPQSLYETL